MHPSNNFSPAHNYFTHAIIALSNPYSYAFSDVCKSSTASVNIFQQLESDNSTERIKKLRETLKEMKNATSSLVDSKQSIISCRYSIQNTLNSTTNTAIEQHADIFDDKDSSDSSKNDEWDDLGSDVEEIE